MPLDTLHVQHEGRDGVHVVFFLCDAEGVVPLESVKHYFATQFLLHTTDWTRLVVDLAGVATLDSSCLGPLVQKFRQCQKGGGRLVLTGVTSPALEEIFALTRFDKVFPITHDREEAVVVART